MKSGSTKEPGLVGKIGLSLFFAIFLGAGLLFFYLIGRELARAAETHRWKETPCRILSSAVNEGKGSSSHGFAVRFQYEWEGRAYTGERLRRSDTKSTDYGDMLRLVDRYPAGATTRCYVNAAAPAEAVLERSTLWIGLALLLPLVFIAVGGGLIWATWRAKPAPEDPENRPISNADRPALARTLGVGFFAIFLVAGLAVTWFALVRPVLSILAARGWTATPCVVVSSDVRTHRGKSTTYSVDILYAYEVNGRTLKANRYSFMGGSSSGRDGKAEIVRRFPRGRAATCYVNPRDPTDAVLHRGWVPMMWVGFLPLIFVAIGLSGIIGTLRKKRAVTAVGAVTRGNFMAEVPAQGVLPGPITLKATKSRVKEFLFLLFFALFWNGIVSVFVVQAVKGWQKGRGDWVMTIFLIPFVLIGAGVLVGCIYKFLQIFAPGVTVRMSAGAVPVGGEVEVSWLLDGRVTSVRKLRLYVEGREEASYRRGTRSYTDKHTFRTIELADATNLTDIREGRARLKIPPDTIHSFEATNNKIVWSLQIKGEIAMFPDIDDDFTLNVLPGAASPAAPAS